MVVRCRWVVLSSVLALLVPSVACGGEVATTTPTPMVTSAVTELPAADVEGEVSLEETLLARRSVRDYTGDALSLNEVSQLLWAAQGTTSEWGGRTAPSAGALYPLEVYLVVGDVEDLAPGVYRYMPGEHALAKTKDGDVREGLTSVALFQEPVRSGAVDIVISAVYERTTRKYGDRGVRYVRMEAGHVAQNVYLQATALGLGTVSIGAFLDDRVKDVLGMPADEEPLYIMPVGRKP